MIKSYAPKKNVSSGSGPHMNTVENNIPKQDASPTKNSTNPVQSGGVYDAIEGGFYFN